MPTDSGSASAPRETGGSTSAGIGTRRNGSMTAGSWRRVDGLISSIDGS